MNSGQLLCTYTDEELNLQGADWINVDTYGNLCVSFKEEYPHIVKYNILMSKIRE